MRSAVIITRCCGRDCKNSQLNLAVEHCNYRVFTDSAPVREVEWPQKSGVGWRGKHTLLLSREVGSIFFPGEIYTDVPVAVDKPIGNYCGSCIKCIDIYPTQAIVAPYTRWTRGAAFLTLQLSIRATSLKSCVR
jgi:epoxyqueuosine reductase